MVLEEFWPVSAWLLANLYHQPSHKNEVRQVVNSLLSLCNEMGYVVMKAAMIRHRLEKSPITIGRNP
jgi:hypothetical protein